MSQSLWNDEQLQPIQHLRVIDVTVMLTGPYLTRLLAQYGADVIKIEKTPDGDPLRGSEFSGLFDFLNQGKKSLGIDLSHAVGMEIVQKLASEADVFVENFREGVMDRLGLGYSDLSEANPDLIYLSLRGLSGKNSIKSAHDLNFIAGSGCGEWFLESGANYSTQFGDIVGGVLTPLLKLLMHLANPNRRGMHIVSNMDEGFRALYLPRAFEAVMSEEKTPEERKHYQTTQTFSGLYPHSRYYKCRDNQWVSLQAVQAKHWIAFCEVVDRKEWIERAKDPVLVPELEKLFFDAPAAYWEALSANQEVCLFRVIPWNEFLGITQTRSQLSTDPLTWAGFAPNPKLGGSPKLGQDSFSILHGFGIDNQTLGKLLAQGILTQRS